MGPNPFPDRFGGIEKGETQTEAEFARDIETLHEIWMQKQEEG